MPLEKVKEHEDQQSMPSREHTTGVRPADPVPALEEGSSQVE